MLSSSFPFIWHLFDPKCLRTNWFAPQNCFQDQAAISWKHMIHLIHHYAIHIIILQRGPCSTWSSSLPRSHSYYNDAKEGSTINKASMPLECFGLQLKPWPRQLWFRPWQLWQLQCVPPWWRGLSTMGCASSNRCTKTGCSHPSLWM